ncbi:hypothetical protein L1049_016464 [Liquidambar formosana]|uniref:F-box domain-containing protein n=1 Tax=Liquidambar formosana TaxID=63359 RepID=A0AAP0S6D4_LIQFO
MTAADGKNEIRQRVEDVIPGLPDDIALECLVRVPYRFHSTMKWVCRGWRTLIAHPSFYHERRRLRTAEHLVCLVQALPSPLPPPPPPPPRDSTTDDCINNITINTAKEVEEELHHHHHHHPLYGGQDDAEDERQLHCPPPLYGLSIYNASRHTWHRMMPNCGFGSSGIPMFCHCVALPSCGKLLLLGGWDPTSLEALPDVYVLDFIGGGFRRAASMSVGRSFFACAAVGPSTVYVGGGHDNQKNALRSAEVYDADADEWRTLPAMAVERDECQGLCWEGDPDGRFWVVSGYSTESQGRFRSDAECYDPATGCWSRVDGVWPFPSMSPRGTTASSVGYEWWWFLGGEQQQQNIINGDALQIRGENNDEWRSKEKRVGR